MNQNLRDYVSRYIELTEDDLLTFESYLRPKHFKKKEYILRAGEICRARYFIVKGCVRQYYIDHKGNEQIVHFAIDNWWISDYDSLVNEKPSRLFLQTTEDTEVLELPELVFERVSKEIPALDQLFRKIIEKTYIAIQKRMEFMFSSSGEELLDIFLTANPEFAQRVPQYMIASYLGLTPEFVSKIRGKKR